MAFGKSWMWVVAAVIFGGYRGVARADEGMWTLDNLPVKLLKERYNFKPTPEWVEHVQLASLRFNDGGSGSFVSSNGLVLTNHHVALGQLQKVSTAEKDYVKNGFFVRTPDEEMKCPDLEINQLVSMQNVTDRVLGAVDPKVSDKEQNEQRKAEMARIEKESTDKTRLRSDAVELYQGGEYWLYRYKKYTDIRLVMAPEMQAAFYGGDPDNFTFPRFDLDMALFRVYEDGKPIRPRHFLKWSRAGAKEGELVFVTGHPGHTSRLDTVAQLEYERDYALPDRLGIYRHRRKALADYAARGTEQARRSKDRIFSYENSIKALTGYLAGVRNPRFMSQKAGEEREFRGRVAQDANLSKAYGGAWDRVATAVQEMTRRRKEYVYRNLEYVYRSRTGSKLAGFAGTIVRYVAEVEKPNDKRYEEFRDSALESLRLRLFSPAPIYADMEETLLTDTLEQAIEELGPNDSYVKDALGGRTPAEQAKALIAETRLADPEVRKKLVEGGPKAVEASADPLIVWARKLDPGYRELRKWYEDNIQSAEALEGNKIAQARFAVYGKSTYPDATFTLRLSYGKVAGYDQGTNRIPYKTTFYGLYDRAASFDHQPPFDLPPAVAARRGDVDLSTPLDFVTTNDIIGGNSGSPVVNRDAELVGLIFDGNIQSLVLDFAYTEEQARAIAVHSSGILEGLRSIYGMGPLAEELTGGIRAP